MNDAQREELKTLIELEGTGTLEDTQIARLAELKTFESLFEKAGKAEKFEKDFQSAEAQKKHFREKFEAEEKARKELEAKALAGRGAPPSLRVEDYIDISTSLEGLDQREKEYISSQHTSTGKPLSEIRKDENFILWQSAYRAKVEKEKSVIPPTSKQPDDTSPISLEDALNGAQSMEEKEALLRDSMGYSVDNKPRGDKVIIGR